MLRGYKVNLFRTIGKTGKVQGCGFTAKVIWPAGGELEQIQFLLGYVSVQTTERYLLNSVVLDTHPS